MTGLVPATNETSLVRVVRSIRDLFEGRCNAFGTFTLAASVTTTAVTAPNCGLDSQALFSPTTANAAAEIASGGMYVSAIAQGTFTVTHANSAQTDRTFAYRIVG